MNANHGPKPARSRLRIGIATTLFFAYFSFVLWVVMSPNLDSSFGVNTIATRVLRVLHRLGVPEGFGFMELEFVANIGMFVPLGFLLGLAFGRGWWLALFLLPMVSVGIEWYQGEYLPGRVADVRDIVSNSVGAWVGAISAGILQAMVHTRDRKVLRRVLWEQQRRNQQAAPAAPDREQYREAIPPTMVLPQNAQTPPYGNQRVPQDPHDAPTQRLNF